MTEYSRMAKGSFTSTGGTQMINLPFQPDYVEMTNVSAWTTPALNGIPFAKWDKNFLNATPANVTLISVYQTATSTDGLGLVTDSVLSASGGITTFAAGLQFQFGPTLAIASITQSATAPIVTTTTAHNLNSGDVVIMQGLFETSTTGMPQIAGIPFTVTVTAPTTFTIVWNNSGSNYAALTGSPAGATLKKVLFPYIYFPGVCVIEGITLGTTTTVVTASAHNFRVGQEVAFRIPTSWGTVELNSLPDVMIPGSPIYGYVTSVTSYNTFVVAINSSSFTAFNPNQTISGTPGRTFPQVVAVGDVNTGGETITNGTLLYPPPFFEPIGTTQISTINGPAIRGAFVNNTSQGFVIGAGTGVNSTSAVLVGAAGNIIEWRAFLHDYSNP
jgi:hypothetical protein